MHTIHLTLLGEPVAKARARQGMSRKGRHYTYTPDPTAHAENAWRDLFHTNGSKPFPPKTPLAVTVVFHLPRPKSLPKKVTRPVSRPDFDNLVKLVTDALQGFAYDNDSRIVDSYISKRFALYPDQPRTEIVIEEAT